MIFTRAAFPFPKEVDGAINVFGRAQVAASQFFYGELVCALEPCDMRTVLEKMVGATIPFAVLEELTLQCSEPNCRAWINMKVNALMVASAGSPKAITNPTTQEEVTVPGGLGLYVPEFTLMGMTGHADVSLGTTSGHVSASLRGPFSPASAQCLTVGSTDDYLAMDLSYDVSSLEFDLDLAAHVAWGNADVAATLTLHTRPLPKFALSLALFVPLVGGCNLDFALEAEAEASLGGSGPLGISGSFSFGGTHFNTEVFGCLRDGVSGAIDQAWNALLGGWGDSATQFIEDLNNALNAAVAAGYNNPWGQCHKIDAMVQTLCAEASSCQSNDEVPNQFGSYGCGNPYSPVSSKACPFRVI
jgi:hypothetical protein